MKLRDQILNMTLRISCNNDVINTHKLECSASWLVGCEK